MGYPRKENQKSSSEMLSRGPQDTPIKNYGQKSILGNFTMYIPLSTSDGWPRGIYGSINLKKFMKPSFAQPKNISEDQTSNPKKKFLNQAIEQLILHCTLQCTASEAKIEWYMGKDSNSNLNIEKNGQNSESVGQSVRYRIMQCRVTTGVKRRRRHYF